MDDLNLPCHVGPPADHMEVTTATSPEKRLVNIRIYDGSETSAQMLTEETARQLFNWLGVWLHKGFD